MSSLISGAGGTTIFIRQVTSYKEYSTDNTVWLPLFTLPIGVFNTDTNAGILTVQFTTNITVDSNDFYFICYSENIQFGSDTLNNDGTRPTITISTTSYNGFVQNGAPNTNGYNNISIYNLYVDGGSNENQTDSGWIAKSYFGYNAANNYIINCASNGIINGGGIVGSFAGSGGQLIIRGCSSSGIIKTNSGGIVGSDSGTIICESCWSTGLIQGDGAGGIIGSNNNSVTISNCYSEGNIVGNNSGGILGSNSGMNSATVTNSYSKGDIIGANAGGICGSIGAITSTYTLSISNCYSVGNLNNSISSLNGGICGALIQSNPGQIFLTISNCYTTGTVTYPSGYIIGNSASVNGTQSLYTLINNYSEAGSGGSPGNWNDTHAKTVLNGTPNPSVGTVWVASIANQPYELLNMGYSPYSLTNISGNQLIRTGSYAVNKGWPTPAGKTSTYTITSPSPNVTGVSINSTTGSISTTLSTPIGVYTLYVRNTGSYNYTVFTLSVVAPICFLKGTKILCANDEYKNIELLETGDMVKTYLHGDVAIDTICHMNIHHSRENEKRDQLFVYKKDNHPILTEDLIVTGGHSILVDCLKGSQAKELMKELGRIFVTDDKFRLLSCLDERADPYEKAEADEVVYHICLEHSNPNMNYGIWANGMLMETCQKSCISKYI
jgi:hypothetical protein